MEEVNNSNSSTQKPMGKSKGAIIVGIGAVIGGAVCTLLLILGVEGVNYVSYSFFSGIGAFLGALVAGIMNMMGKLPNEPKMTKKQKISFWIFWGIIIAIAIWIGIMFLFVY